MPEKIKPEKIKNSESVGYIIKISKLLPLTNVDYDKLECEWRLLQQDEKVRFYLNKNERIDTYWSGIFNLKSHVDHQSPKYVEIKRVVQNALALTHGNADVERGFSISSKILTPEKSRMTEKTLNAKLYITDGLKKHDKLVYKVPITADLIKLAQGAYSSYKLYLEKERLIIEQEAAKKAIEIEKEAKKEALLESLKKEKQTIKHLENELKSAEKNCKAASQDTESMQNALKDAITKNAKYVVVKEMMNSLDKLRDTEKEARKKVDELQCNIRRRNSSLINSQIAPKKTRVE